MYRIKLKKKVDLTYLFFLLLFLFTSLSFPNNSTKSEKFIFFPYFSVETSILSTDIESERYQIISRPNMLSLGGLLKKSIFFSSLSLSVPWHKDNSTFLLNLDVTLGLNFNSIYIFGGKSFSLNKEGCDDLVQPSQPFYAGSKIVHKLNKNIILENGVMFSSSKMNDLFFKNRMYTYDLYNKISLITKKNIHPYLSFSIGKTNLTSDLIYRFGIGVTIGKSPVLFYNTPFINVSSMDIIVYAPNIYLYPPKSKKVDVKVIPNGKMIASYPRYKNGWSVIAEPDGTIENTPGYLFYEAKVKIKHPNEGWCVSYEKLCFFLKKILYSYGLNKTEVRDFLVYWLASLPQSDYYGIYPIVGKKVDEICDLKIEPVPDKVLRLWILFKPLQNCIKLDKPEIPVFFRDGFSVVEWGGLLIGKHK